MVKMMVNDQEYVIPEVLTVEQWCSIIRWDFTEPKHWVNIIATLTGAPRNLLLAGERETLEMGVIFISTSINRRTEVPLRDFNTITFGEWVDLDVYMSVGADKHLKDMMNILYPECKDASEALWVIDKYVEFRTHILRQYKELFGIEEYDFEGDEPEDIDGMTVARNWYRIIVDLAKDDVLKLDEVTEQPLKKILNFMALQKDKALEEQRRLKQQQKQYDLQRNR